MESAFKVELAFSLSVVLQDEAQLPSGLTGASSLAPFFRAQLPFLPSSTPNSESSLPSSRRCFQIDAPGVGKPGWESIKLIDPAAAEAAAAARPPSAKVDPKAKPDPKAKAAAPAQPSGAGAPIETGPVLLRHTTTISTVADADFIAKLNAEPLAIIMMGVKPAVGGNSSGSATSSAPAAAPPKGGKGAAPAPASATSVDAALTAPGVRPFLLFLPLDCSPLLTNVSSVGCAYGSSDAAIGAIRPSPVAGASPMNVGVNELEKALGCSLMPSKGVSLLEAPSLFSFLHVCVRVVSATQTKIVPVDEAAVAAAAAATALAAAAAAAPPAKGAKGKAAPVVEAPPEPTGPKTVDESVIPPCLLSASLLKKVNPISFSLGTIDGLPGVVLPQGSDSSMRQYLLPDAYELQRKHCRPTYAVLRLPSALSSSTFPKSQTLVIDEAGTTITLPIPRSVTLISSSSVPGPRFKPLLNTAICAGLVDSLPLRESLRTEPAIAEVHDRDCFVYEHLQLVSRKALLQGVSVEGAIEEAPRAVSGGPTSAILSLLLPTSWAWPTVLPSRIDELEKTLKGERSWPSSSLDATSSRSNPSNGVVDVYDIDYLFAAEALHSLARSGDMHAHGFSEFRLEGLLDRQSEQRAILENRWKKGPGSVQPLKINLVGGIIASNRKMKPKIPEPLHVLSKEEALVIAPCEYAVGGARVKVTAEVLRPDMLHPSPLLQATYEASIHAAELASPPFERIVFYFKNDEHGDNILQAVVAAVEEANQKSGALPDSVSTRTHVLTADQQQAAHEAKLDILTGCHFIDVHVRRVLIIEGLADGAMRNIHAAIGPRQHHNNKDWYLLSNPNIRFHSRLYIPFGLTLKHIRLRRSLSIICEDPALYNAMHVSPLIRDTLLAVLALTRADTLAVAKEAGSWPTARGILEVENKFGDTVSLSDMYGRGHPAAQSLELTQGRLAETLHLVSQHVPATLESSLMLTSTLRDGLLIDSNEGKDGSSAEEEGKQSSRSPRSRRKDGLSSKNDAYLSSLRSSQQLTRDFISQNIETVQIASTQVATKRVEDMCKTLGPEKASLIASLPPGTTLDTVNLKLPGDGQVYAYSGQKLNTSEWQKEVMRQRLFAQKNSTFTHGPEFGSLTVSLVNQEKEMLESSARSKAAWKTKEGFVYPAQKTLEGDLVHPKHPPSSRVDDLGQPWIEPNEIAALERAQRQADSIQPGRIPYRGEYKEPNPLKTTRDMFGYIDKDGSQKLLEFQTSVHPTGDVLDAQQKEDRERDAKNFQSHLVVDSTRFKTHNSFDGNSKLNRVGSLLRSEPVKAPIQHIALGASMKKGQFTQPFSPMPIGMDAELPFTESLRDAALLRAREPSKFVGPINDKTGFPLDFANPAPKDVVKGTIRAIYTPHFEASQRPTAHVGVKPSILRLQNGINTDRKVN